MKTMLITLALLLLIASPTLAVSRPNYCMDTECVKDLVFEDLPHFPEDFEDKWLLMYVSKIPNLDVLQEKYWKQPEFYEDTFEDQCIEIYLKNQVASAGSGPYPGDILITNVSQGERIAGKTFWHSDCAIGRYQAFGLGHEFPEHMNMRLADVEVNQDPIIAEECFDISVSPDTIVLDPTFPKYKYNWARKVIADIKVSDDCPGGTYGIMLFPSEPEDPTVMDALMFEYGPTKVSTIMAGGAWQILIKVNEKPAPNYTGYIAISVALAILGGIVWKKNLPKGKKR